MGTFDFGSEIEHVFSWCSIFAVLMVSCEFECTKCDLTGDPDPEPLSLILSLGVNPSPSGYILILFSGSPGTFGTRTVQIPNQRRTMTIKL